MSVALRAVKERRHCPGRATRLCYARIWGREVGSVGHGFCWGEKEVEQSDTVVRPSRLRSVS
jgi:hypothetical protein